MAGKRRSQWGPDLREACDGPAFYCRGRSVQKTGQFSSGQVGGDDVVYVCWVLTLG